MLQYVTPALLLIVFVAALITPKDNDWEAMLSGKWDPDPSSIIGKIQNKGVIVNRDWFSDKFEVDREGFVSEISELNDKQIVKLSDNVTYYTNEAGYYKPVTGDEAVGTSTFDSVTVIKTYKLAADKTLLVKEGDKVSVGSALASGSFTNNIFYTDMAKFQLVLLFAFIGIVVAIATRKRRKENRSNQKLS